MAERPIVTGTVISRFGPQLKSEYSDYAAMPRELSHLVDQLAKLEYPIGSKRELLEKLGGSAAPLYIGENVVEAGAALMFLPATFFPLANPVNLAEKLSEEYARRVPFERRRQLNAAEVDDLVQRFVAENPDFLVAVAKAVQTFNAFDLAKAPDDEVVAGQFMKENRRLIDSAVSAFSGIGRLRAKSREDLQEKPRRSATS